MSHATINLYVFKEWLGNGIRHVSLLVTVIYRVFNVCLSLQGQH